MSAEYMNVKEVADALGVSEVTARKIIREKLPHLRIGRGEYRVYAPEFSAYLETLSNKPTETRRST